MPGLKPGPVGYLITVITHFCYMQGADIPWYDRIPRWTERTKDATDSWIWIFSFLEFYGGKENKTAIQKFHSYYCRLQYIKRDGAVAVRDKEDEMIETKFPKEKIE